MVVFDYFEDVLEGFEYLIALGSIMGLLGVMLGIIFLVWGGQRVRNKMIGVIIASFVLLAVCGLDTGIKYFRIFQILDKKRELEINFRIRKWYSLGFLLGILSIVAILITK